MNRNVTSLVLVFVGAAAITACRNRSTEGTAPPTSPRESPQPARSDVHAPTAVAPPSDGAPPSAGSDIEAPAPAAEFTEAARFLPQGRVVDWVQSGPVARATAANLFQIIDGAAVAYERYGVRNYAKTDYRKPGTTLVATIEVYEFATPLGAFGRYSLTQSDGRDPATLQPQSVRLGGGGYQGTTQLTFWKGSVLVQISVSDTSDEPNEAQIAAAAHEALTRLGDAVEHLVPGQIAPPLSPLPAENQVWGGSTYLADGVFGVDQSGPAWVGHYRSDDGKRYRLAIFMRASVADAQSVLAHYHALPNARPVAGLGDEAFSAMSQQGEVVVARRGNHVFAVADAGVPNLPAPTRDAKIAIVRSASSATLPSLPPDTGATPPAH